MGGSDMDIETGRFFWHPVCTRDEVLQSYQGLGCLPRTTLLGVEIVVAKQNSGMETGHSLTNI